MSSVSSSWRGTLYPASVVRQNACSVSSVGRASPRGVTMAAIRSTSRSSGTPTTTASKTSGCAFSAASTSSGYTFSPPVLMHTDPRPSRCRVPSASIVAESPGTTQRTPSASVTNVAAVLSSSL